HLPQIVVAGLVDGDAEGRDAGRLAFLNRHHRVLDSVRVRAPVRSVVEVLGKPVRQEEDMPRAGGDVRHLRARVAKRRAHAGRPPWLDAADGAAHASREAFLELLHEIELDVLPTLPGKTVDRV